MSGSPGYIDNYPVKIGFTPTKKPMTSYIDGFEILGASRGQSARGECLSKTEVLGDVDYGDPVIRFK